MSSGSSFQYFFVTLSPLLILSFILLLHYHTHFKLKLCGYFQTRHQSRQLQLTIVNVSTDRLQTECPFPKHDCCSGCFSLIPKDQDDKYNFFPLAFFYLIILKMIICAFIILLHVTSASEFVHISIFAAESKQQKLFVILSGYILRYSVMLFSIWESLLSFYQCYTTYKVATSIKSVSTAPVIMRFMFYAIVFAALFCIQVQFWYYLWPIVLFVHTVFNFVCIFTFSCILIEKYQVLSGMDDRIDSGNANILHSVYVMRRISVLSNVVHTAALALFTISYCVLCVHTIYYLPLFWSVSTAIYAFNFVRNRNYVSWKVFECAQNLKYLSVCANDQNKKSDTTSTSPLEDGENGIEIKVTEPPTIIIKAKFSDIRPSQSTKNSVISVPDTVQTLQLLTLQSCSTTSPPSPRESFPKLNPMAQSQSHDMPSPRPITKGGRMLPAMKITYSRSDANYAIGDNKNEMEREETLSQVSKSYLRHIPLRRVSSPSLPVEFIADDAHDLVSIDLHDGDATDEDEDDECVFVNYGNETKVMEFDLQVDYPPPPDGVTVPDRCPKPSPLQFIKHQTSNSTPAVISDILQNMNLVQAMDSWDLFAKYGFCSRNSIESLHELTRYKDKIHPTTNQINK